MSHQSFTSPEQLFKFLQLKNQPDYFNSKAASQFKFLVPFSFAQRMKKNAPDDPLLLQVLPHHNELIEYPGFNIDPLLESSLINQNGLLQKYQHRLLLMPTSSCGIHCRYCFRRHYPYNDTGTNKQLIQQISHIKNSPQITEVILSGGDPLTLSDDKLSFLLSELKSIKHLKRLRIHSRQLIVDPARISAKLISLFKHYPIPIALVLHCNHPNELDQFVKDSLSLLRLNNVQLLNQSVLLKGVNDQADILCELSEKLYEFGILAYYLHQLDPIAGSQHFAIDDEIALRIYKQMQIKLPGYLLPKLVREVNGGEFKQLLGTNIIDN